MIWLCGVLNPISTVNIYRLPLALVVNLMDILVEQRLDIHGIVTLIHGH